MNRELETFQRHARATHGDKLDLSNVESVAPAIRAYFRGARIEVTRTYEDGTTWTRRGRVSVTSGWRPSLMLMPRADSRGSSDLLDSTDRLVRVITT